MADGEEKGSDFYAVLGLDKECTDSELRNSYKKLALDVNPGYGFSLHDQNRDGTRIAVLPPEILSSWKKPR